MNPFDERGVTMQTKALLRAAGVGLSLLMVAATVSATEAEPATSGGCSLRTVRGTWLGGGTGWSLVDTPLPAPTTVITTLVLDGHGGATGTTFEKAITLELERGVIHGTYTLDSDCTGTATLTDTHPDGTETHTFAVMVAPDGSELQAVATEEPLAVHLTLRRVPRR
jgi:hypothetical protein